LVLDQQFWVNIRFTAW